MQENVKLNASGATAQSPNFAPYREVLPTRKPQQAALDGFEFAMVKGDPSI